MISRPKGPRLAVLLISVAGICLALSCGGPKAHADTRQQQFLAVVKYLADYVDLTDPVAVGRALQTTVSVRKQWSMPLDDCKGSAATIQSTYIYAAASDFWYQPTPEGRHFFVQGLPVLPGGQSTDTMTGDPEFRYLVSKTTACSGQGHGMERRAEADMTFDGLPAYACITENDLKAGLPGGKVVWATDGFRPFEYYGRSIQDTGVYLEADNRECAFTIRMFQNEHYGKREMKVRDEIDTCKKKFYAEHHHENPAGRCPSFDVLMREELGQH